MNTRLNHQQLLRYAGLFTWVMVGVPLAYAWHQGLAESGLMARSLAGWVVSFAAFGLLYVRVAGRLSIYRTSWRDGLYLFLLSASAIAVS